jgi:hypothetical protein
MASRRTRHIAREQSMFRAVNERVNAWPERQALPVDEKIMRYCECADPHCFAPVYLTREEYETIRADSTRFAVADGHLFLEAERVVAEPDGYEVVEKNDDLRGLLERIDPRKGAYATGDS